MPLGTNLSLTHSEQTVEMKNELFDGNKRYIQDLFSSLGKSTDILDHLQKSLTLKQFADVLQRNHC